MTDHDPDDALLRSAFHDLQRVVPSPAPERLATMEATVRRRRVTGVAATGVLVAALLVTPAFVAFGDSAADPVGVPVTPSTDSAGGQFLEPASGGCLPKDAPPDVDLSVTATDLTMGPQPEANERWRGDMAITVCNLGGAAAPAGTLTLRWRAVITPDAEMGTESWAACRSGQPEHEGGVTYAVAKCSFAELGPGAKIEHMFLFDMPGSADPGIGERGTEYVEVSKTADTNTRNNRATFGVTAADALGGPNAPACKAKNPSPGVDLSVVATNLTLGPEEEGSGPRRGDIGITVCNNGREAAPAGTLTLRWRAAITPDAEMGTESWEGCRYAEPQREAGVVYSVVKCDYAELGAGRVREHMYLFEMPSDVDPGVGKPGNQYAEVSRTADTNTRDNRATFVVATV